MFEGYHKLSNAHALRAVTKEVYLPEVRLGVGAAENLSALPDIIQYPTVLKTPVLPDLYQMPIEGVTVDGQGSLFTADDFSNSGYIGQQIGGL